MRQRLSVGDHWVQEFVELGHGGLCRVHGTELIILAAGCSLWKEYRDLINLDSKHLGRNSFESHFHVQPFFDLDRLEVNGDMPLANTWQ